MESLKPILYGGLVAVGGGIFEGSAEAITHSARTGSFAGAGAKFGAGYKTAFKAVGIATIAPIATAYMDRYLEDKIHPKAMTVVKVLGYGTGTLFPLIAYGANSKAALLTSGAVLGLQGITALIGAIAR